MGRAPDRSSRDDAVAVHKVIWLSVVDADPCGRKFREVMELPLNPAKADDSCPSARGCASFRQSNFVNLRGSASWSSAADVKQHTPPHRSAKQSAAIDRGRRQVRRSHVVVQLLNAGSDGARVNFPGAIGEPDSLRFGKSAGNFVNGSNSGLPMDL